MAKHDRWVDNDILETFRKREYPVREIRAGTTLTHTGSRTIGIVAEFTQGGHVVLTDQWGEQHSFQALDGAFMHNGVPVATREPVPARRVAPQFTALGSVDTDESRARVASASRIWVEGARCTRDAMTCSAQSPKRVWACRGSVTTLIETPQTCSLKFLTS
jgi:hypothetical protein